MTASALRQMAEAVAALKRAINALCVMTDEAPLPEATRANLASAFVECKASLLALSDSLHDEARAMTLKDEALADAMLLQEPIPCALMPDHD